MQSWVNIICISSILTITMLLKGTMLIPVAALSKAWARGQSLAGIEGSDPAGGMDVFLL
jgi:hypothetical protein